MVAVSDRGKTPKLHWAELSYSQILMHRSQQRGLPFPATAMSPFPSKPKGCLHMSTAKQHFWVQKVFNWELHKQISVSNCLLKCHSKRDPPGCISNSTFTCFFRGQKGQIPCLSVHHTGSTYSLCKVTNKLLCAHAFGAGLRHRHVPVCVARRPASVHEQRSIHLPHPLILSACCLSQSYGLCLTIASSRKTTREKWHLPLSTGSFLASLTGTFPWNLHLSLLCAHDCLCIPCLHQLDFWKFGICFVSCVLFRGIMENPGWSWAIFGEQPSVWLTLLFGAAVRSWNNWNN